MESALKFGGINFATRQRHSFENALVPECGFLIKLLLHSLPALIYGLIVGFVVFLCHRDADGEANQVMPRLSLRHRRDATTNRIES